MPLDFPLSPANNQTYTDTVSGLSYKYEAQNGYWKAFTNSAAGLTTITFKSTNYILAANDAGSLIAAESPNDLTFTIPANSVIAFPIGTRIDVLRYGTGNLSFNIAVSDVLRSSGNAVNLLSQFSGGTLLKTKNTEWLLIGDVGAI